jgi:hypothetical protein
MTRLPWLPIIYVRAHYIIQLEIHKNTSYFSGNTDAAVNKKNNKITCNECLWLLAHDRWFSPGTPASSSTTKTGRYDIAEILLKVALNTINQIKSVKLKRVYTGLHTET